MAVLLTRRATLQAAVESSYNTPATVGNSDGVLVETPDFTITPNVLERDFTRPDLSALPFVMGRKIAKMEFTTELRGNGKEGDGIASDAPVIARLFQACGYSLSGHAGQTVIGPYQTNDQNNPIHWDVTSFAKAANVFTETSTNNFLATDTLQIGNVTYTWVATGAAVAANEISLGANYAASIANLLLAINNAGTPGVSTYGVGTTPQTEVSAAMATNLTITALVAGAAGNSIPCIYTDTGGTPAGAFAVGHTTALYGGADAGTNTDVIAYYIAVDTGGPSATAKVTVTSDTAGEGSASQTITTATPLDLGTNGLVLTPTFTGNLVIGQRWVIWMLPAGITLQPVSDNFTSVTLVMNKDGVQHTMPGALGTFEITADAGAYAKVKWTFTGTYVEPIDNVLPNPNYETTLPSQVQLARLMADAFPAIVAKFTYNQGNDVQVRLDVSGPEGYLGVRIVSRKPEGGIDPEADNVANYDFWGYLSAAQRMPFQMRVGIASGNAVWMIAPNVQYSGMTYQDRQGILTYQAGMRFARQSGNDEMFFHFC